MADVFSSFNIDPTVGTEILDILNLPTYALDDPKKFQQVKDITDHFKGQADTRYQILKLLNGKYGDKLDILWQYVALEKEKQLILQRLNPDDFEPDVVEEINQGHITKDKFAVIKDDIEKRLAAEERQRQSDEKRYEADKTRVMEKMRLESIKVSLKGLEDINKELNAYG